MKATDTRNKSYKTLTKEDKLTRQRTVLELLKKHGDLTDRQIASYLGWSINRITGRRYELLEKGLIEDKGKVKDSNTNRTVHVWGVTQGQLRLI